MNPSIISGKPKIGLPTQIAGNRGRQILIRRLLMCGILSSLLYVAMNVFVPLLFDGYSYIDQTISELSAINAPTRTLWVVLAAVYILLFATFGYGVLQSAAGNQRLRMAGRLMLVYSLINIYWPPMHLRGAGTSLTDTLHIAWAMVAVLFMMFIMGFGAAASGKLFRIYTIVSMILLSAFGYITGTYAPKIPVDLPTPGLGIWERIMLSIFMLWVVVFAVMLIRREKAAA